MKCVCIQYIEAIRKLHSIDPAFKPQRTIHLTFVSKGTFFDVSLFIIIALELTCFLSYRYPMRKSVVLV